MSWDLLSKFEKTESDDLTNLLHTLHVSQKPAMVIAESPKIFDVQCIWGRIFVSQENLFVCKYL